MYAGFETAKVEFEGKSVTVSIDSKDGLTLDWTASNSEDDSWVRGLIGFERCLSRAIDSDDAVGEYKSITVTVA